MATQSDPVISVLIVEDDDLARTRLVSRIEAIEGMTVIAAAATLDEGRRAFGEHTPDVLLCDLGLPDGDGTDLIRERARVQPMLPILVISMFGDEGHVIRAIEAGAAGYLLKDDESETIETVIRQLLAGGSPISAAIARHLVRRFHPPVPVAGVTLSTRELEVPQLAAKGFSYKETAGMLAVSVNTVSSYTKRIYEKLAVNSRSEAVYEAGRLGLMDERSPR